MNEKMLAREPTEAMIEAAAASKGWGPDEFDGAVIHPAIIWQAMFDAAPDRTPAGEGVSPPPASDEAVEQQAVDLDRLLGSDWAEVLAAVARGEIEDGIMPGLGDDRRVSQCAGDTLIAAKLEIERLQADLDRADAVVEAIIKSTESHIDGRDLLAELHPRRMLDIKRRVDGVETWFQGDWLSTLFDAVKQARSFIASRRGR
jgi:hypothetical protein